MATTENVGSPEYIIYSGGTAATPHPIFVNGTGDIEYVQQVLVLLGPGGVNS